MSFSREKRSASRSDVFISKVRRSASMDPRARGSYVPDRRRPSSEDRRSDQRWSGFRKSSIGLSDVKKKDIRPLTDKAYQKRKIADLVAFLEEQEFNYPISAAKLASPSKKDFDEIFKFLYSLLDPRYEIKKMEDEAMKILKNLTYPFNINKSAFAYVARTNWPSLLGVLIWLMDLAKFAVNVNVKSVYESEDGLDGEKTQIHKLALKYIYQSHFSGEDDPEEDDQAFSVIVKSVMLNDLEELLEKRNVKAQELSDIEKNLDFIKALSDDEIKIEQSIVAYEEYIKKMNDHLEKTQGSKLELMEKQHESETELQYLKDQIASKQEAYDAQGFDGQQQMIYYENLRTDLIRKLEKKQSLAKELQNQIWEAEIQIQQHKDKVDECAVSFKEMYNKSVEAGKLAVEPLQHVDNSIIQKLFTDLQSISSWDIPLNLLEPNMMPSIKATKENLPFNFTEINQLLQTVMKDFYFEKLNEIKNRKSELKLLSQQESQCESDLLAKEKRCADIEKSLEIQYDNLLESITALKTKRSRLETDQDDASKELITLKNFHESKVSEYKNFVMKYDKLCQNLQGKAQDVGQKALKYKNKISEELNRFILDMCISRQSALFGTHEF